MATPVTAWPVTVRTFPVGAPYTRREGQTTVYAGALTRQEAEDAVRVWLADLSDTARVYTPDDKPARTLGPVISGAGAAMFGEDVAIVPRGALYVPHTSNRQQVTP